MTKNRWLNALLAWPVMGSARTDNGPPSNSAQVSAFITNGTLGTFSTEFGGPGISRWRHK